MKVDLDDVADMLSVIADGGIILSKTVNDKQALARQMLLYRDFIRAVFIGVPVNLGSYMKLIAHVIDGHQVDIRPAPVERD